MLPLTLFSLLLCFLSPCLCVFYVYVYLMSCVPVKLIHLHVICTFCSGVCGSDGKHWMHAIWYNCDKLESSEWLFSITRNDMRWNVLTESKEPVYEMSNFPGRNDVAGYLYIQKWRKITLTFSISLEGILVFKSKKKELPFRHFRTISVVWYAAAGKGGHANNLQ